MADIRVATMQDFKVLSAHDGHISEQNMEEAIKSGRIFIVEEQDKFAGWLRYNFFWDNTPFMNMLYVTKEARGKGYGSLLTAHWENRMKEAGHKVLMTSTASDECAQHFYHRLGYKTVGGFFPEGEPYELILAKTL